MNEKKMTQEQLKEVGEYVRGHLPQWLQGNGTVFPSAQTVERSVYAPVDLVERIVRVEEALKHQSDFLQDMLKQMNIRFEDFNKRFEETRQRNDSRFKHTNALLTTIFIVLGVLITVFGLLN